MRKNIAEYLDKIVNDKNLKREEREMLIVLKSFDKGNFNKVQVKVDLLMACIDTSNRGRVFKILKGLESKDYLYIEKGSGRIANTYNFIKDYMIIEENTSDESYTTKGDYSNQNYTTKEACSNESYTTKDICSNQNYTIENDYSNQNHTTKETCSNQSYTTKEVCSNQNYTAKGSYSNQNYTTISDNNINNNNYINNNLNDVFINIFKHWNKQNISNTLKLDLTVTDSITTALSRYSFETIIKAISNYSEVYYSSYFYNIKWNLNSFLTSSKGIDKFHDNGCMWQKYKESCSDDESYEGGYYNHDILDKYSYIDA